MYPLLGPFQTHRRRAFKSPLTSTCQPRQNAFHDHHGHHGAIFIVDGKWPRVVAYGAMMIDLFYWKAYTLWVSHAAVKSQFPQICRS